MAFGDLSLIAFLKTKMKWHQARQGVLAENVANADTPRYRPNDLKAMSFADAVKKTDRPTPVAALTTHKAHIAGPAIAASGRQFADGKRIDWEITPAGNAVVLEEQMTKVARNQFDYQLASTLYSRSIGLMRTALGRSG
ncbi:MAG: flagellar basal body rod protein FlgB [Methyloligellaceae bacterium]